MIILFETQSGSQQYPSLEKNHSSQNEHGYEPKEPMNNKAFS